MFDLKDSDNISVVTVPESLDSTNSEDLLRIIYDLIEDGRYSIVMDMSQTNLMDSNGLSAIVVKIPEARSHGGNMRLVFRHVYIKHQLDVTMLDKVFPCYETVDSAISSFP
jgi:anti-sigma B factor antagonist